MDLDAFPLKLWVYLVTVLDYTSPLRVRMSRKSPDSCVSHKVDIFRKKIYQKILSFKKVTAFPSSRQKKAKLLTDVSLSKLKSFPSDFFKTTSTLCETHESGDFQQIRARKNIHKKHESGQAKIQNHQYFRTFSVLEIFSANLTIH